MKHHQRCRADYPEKPLGEAPQATTDIPYNNGRVVRTCVDCGAFEMVNVSQRAPLVHNYPTWETPEDDPGGEAREVWYGKARIVRNRRRRRKLQRRGVPLMDCRAYTRAGYTGPRCWMWFTEMEVPKFLENVFDPSVIEQLVE